MLMKKISNNLEVGHANVAGLMVLVSAITFNQKRAAEATSLKIFLFVAAFVILKFIKEDFAL